MVRCAKGALYTGIATDVARRVKEHNSGKGAKAVKALGLPVKLEYVCKYPMAKSVALQSEAFVKSWDKEKKEKFIKTIKYFRESDAL
jgi:putative endonuclease